MNGSISSKVKEDGPWDVVIIGSGPAGLAAAIYTARGAISTLVIGGATWGGQLMLTTLVENYPGFPEGVQGPELMQKMREQAEKFGVEFLQFDANKVDLKTNPFKIEAGGAEYFARSIIIATGASVVWLDAPGIKRYIGRGVSSCAPCDAPFFKDKKVVVVGGGDSAMEEALVLTKYALEVTVIHRRDTFRASKTMQEKVLANPKIKILWNSEIHEVKGGDKVESVVLLNNKTQKTSEILVDGVFIAIGHKPASDLFTGQLETDDRGFVKIIKPHAKTSVPGVFAAGDVIDPYYKQVATATGSGCAAALEVLEYLQGLVK